MGLDPSLYTSTLVPTRQDVINLVNLHSGSAIVGWQFWLLDHNLVPINMTNPPNPDVPYDVGPYVEACTIKMDTSQEVVRQMDLTLNEVPGLQINPLVHRIQPRCIFYDWLGRQLINVPMGVFRFTLPDRELTDAANTWTGTWQDLSSRIAEIPFIFDFVTPIGMKATDIMKGMALADSRPAGRGGRVTGGGTWPFVNAPSLTPAGCLYIGPNWPASRLAIADSPIQVAQPITWSNTDKLPAALAQLATLANYWTPWVDPVGKLTGVPNPYQYLDPSGNMILPQSDWTYEYGQDSIIDGKVVVSYPDLTKACNAVFVFAANNNGPVIYAEAWNESLDSNISVPSYGDTIPRIVNDSSIPDQATADLRARVELEDGAQWDQQVTFSAHVNPFIDANSFFGANVLAKDGTPEIRVDRYPYRCTSFEIDVFTRMQTIVGRRVVPV